MSLTNLPPAQSPTPHWITWITEQPNPDRIETPHDALTMALTMYRALVQKYGVIEGIKRYRVWQQNEAAKQVYDTSDIHKHVPLVNDVVQDKNATPRADVVNQLRRTLRDISAKVPLPTADRFVVLVKAVDRNGNSVGLIDDVEAEIPDKIRAAWQVVADTFNVPMDTVKMKLVPALKGALTYSTNIPVPDGDDDDVVQKLHNNLLDKKLIEETPLKQVRWIEWNPEVNRSKTAIEPVITINILV